MKNCQYRKPLQLRKKKLVQQFAWSHFQTWNYFYIFFKDIFTSCKKWNSSEDIFIFENRKSSNVFRNIETYIFKFTIILKIEDWNFLFTTIP